jgi:hypothetical protein
MQLADTKNHGPHETSENLNKNNRILTATLLQRMPSGHRQDPCSALESFGAAFATPCSPKQDRQQQDLHIRTPALVGNEAI